MKLKNAIMISLLGRQSDRFTVYSDPRTLAERLDIVRGMDGVDGIEVGYPGEFADLDKGAATIKASGFGISAVNQNTKRDPRWRVGSFTSPDPATRAMAIREMKICMDLSVDLGCNLVHCCPLIDGHNYNFQVDYSKQWAWLVEGLSEAASYRSDVRISLEFKPFEARNFNIVSNTGMTLYLASLVGENVGLTFDMGHSLMAKESPAETASIAMGARRLFYMHFNDNMRDWDWDMLPGAVNVWDLVETLYYMDRLGWDGWCSYDVLSRSGGDTVQNQVATLEIMRLAQLYLDKISGQELEDIIARGHPYEAIPYLWKGMVE